MLYDVLIIGSGPAGLTAAIYATRAGFKTLLVAGLKWGGQLQLTTDVENYPGFPEGIQGPELMTKMRKQAEKYGAEFIDADLPETDFSTQPQGGPFTITVQDKTYTGKALLIATGEDTKWLEVPGEKERIGRGISSCAPCDAPFFRNKKVIVVGGGDSAMEEAMVLTNFATEVILMHRRDTFRASQIMQDKVKANPKIKIMFNTQITEILGENRVQSVKLLNNATNETSEMLIDGVFVAIGHIPNSKVFKGIELKDGGYVRAQNGTRTNIEGIFVSGDIEDDRYRQAITAAGFGCMAALDIEKWLMERS